MRPIPETVQALDELDAQLDDGTLLDRMHRTAALAQDLVPGLVGFSIAAHRHGVTFTVVATDEEIAALDAVQYLTHGPCVDALAANRGLATSSDELFEGKHQVLATLFSAWAPGAVTNADLAFSTRRLAEQAPANLRRDAVVDTAIGILAASRETSVADARQDLEDSAARAGVATASLARMIIDLHHEEG